MVNSAWIKLLPDLLSRSLHDGRAHLWHFNTLNLKVLLFGADIQDKSYNVAFYCYWGVTAIGLELYLYFALLAIPVPLTDSSGRPLR